MDFAFSEEQELLRGSAREFLAEQYPLERVGEIVDNEPGWAPQSWKQLADLGWLDAELGLLDQVVVFEEAGYGLLPAPLFSALALALPAIERDQALLDSLAAGELRPTLAWAQQGQRQELRVAAEGAAVAVDGDGRVHGQAVLVPDATTASAFVVVTIDGLRLVDAGDARVTPRATTDRTRRLGDVSFTLAPSVLLVPAADTPAVLAAIERRALVLAAAEAIGVARRAVDIAVEYASTREQFGRPIGSYQAVSHQVVDAYAATELARSLTYWAGWAVAESDELADAACSAAKSSAAEAAVLACERAIQVCGGIGFTWEHVLHRLYKRALWLEAFGGSGRDHRARIAEAIL
jgi:alkylation response protein AidB-like acyl-CoA dehydrogenase